MESVLFVGIDIKVVAWDEHGLRAVAEDWLEVPPAVDASRVEQYVMARFGDPVDVAMGRTDRFGELVLGWVFPSSTLEPLGLPADGLEMMVVPYVRFPDGTRRELFEYNAELHHEFSALAALLDPGAAPVGDQAPAEQRGRLDEEQLALIGPEREQVEEQVGGWLRRMLAEGWTYLILEVPDTGRYVQFLTHDGDWLRGEVVGNRYLGGHELLDDDEHRRLVDLGWNEPGDTPEDCGNYWLDWGNTSDEDELAYAFDDRVTDRDVDEAARFAAATLCEVFGPLHVDDVDVVSGTASSTSD